MSAELMSDKLRHLSVLIVDDNAGDRFLYREMLQEADPGTDFMFQEADSGQSALKCLDEQSFDCLLLDYLLPDMLGLELLKVWSERRKPVLMPIIMLTGFGDEATAVSALQAGAQGYIPKRDLTGATLSGAMDRAIRANKARQRRENSQQEIADRNKELELKYKQADAFYQGILGKLKMPVSNLRDQLADLTKSGMAATESERRRQLLGLSAESERILTALKNLMDNPGLEVGQLLISTRQESLVDVISAAANAFKPCADAAEVRLSVKVQPGLPDVQMDRYRIEQVLSNLLDNAVKFTPPMGQIDLLVNCFSDAPHEISIRVTDTGPGIPPGKLEHLFERNIHSTSTDSEDSMGLGLPLCREIIGSHKGQISAKNMDGAGACINFTLPLDVNKTSSSETWDQASRKIQVPADWGLHA